MTEPTRDERIAELTARLDAAEGDDWDAMRKRDELVADRNEVVYDAASNLLDTIFIALVETEAQRFTCTEVEAIADLFKAMNRADDAAEVIASHAREDEEGDDHFDDGMTLIAGALFDNETGEEVDDGEHDVCVRKGCGHIDDDHGDLGCEQCDCDRFTQESENA